MGGKGKQIKRTWHFFMLPDYEKEEQYLSQMAAQGWRFVDTNGFRYTFERTAPEQVAYRIDFSGLNTKDRGDYLTMFRDFGWEYLQDINGFSYFRKSTSGVSSEDLEIFSDNNSRIEMMKRILQRKMLPLLCIFLSVGVPNTFRCIDLAMDSRATGFDIALLIAMLSIMLIYLYIFVHCLRGFHRLKQKYHDGV